MSEFAPPRIKIQCAIVLALLAGPRAISAQAAAWLVRPDHAGLIATGIGVDSLYRLVGRAHTTLVDQFAEGFFTPALEITVPGASVAPALIATIRAAPCGEFVVSSLKIRDPRFRTREGIGVGSTLAEVQAVYATVRSHEEGEHALVPSLRMRFDLATPPASEHATVTAVVLTGAVSKADVGAGCGRRSAPQAPRGHRLT